MLFFNLVVPLVSLAVFVAASTQEPLFVPSSCSSFNPLAYNKSLARCSAVNRQHSEPTPTEIDIHYVDINPTAERTLLLVHGWPSLWSTWSYQIQQFEKDYHLVVPNLRGFADSTHPGDVETSGTMEDMVSDLACVLQHANVQHKVVCVGHDWGAQICWEAARMRPDLVEAVAGAVVPYISAAGPFAHNEELAALVPGLTYQIFFEKRTQAAAAELNASIRRTLRATYRGAASPPPSHFLRSSTSFLEAWSEYEEIPPIPFLSPAEEDYLVEQFSIQGFEKTLQFYTLGNRVGTWNFDRAQGNFSIPQPALYIMPTDDPVADWKFASAALRSSSFFTHLNIETMGTQHWPHLEQPDTFNLILQNWLNTL